MVVRDGAGSVLLFAVVVLAVVVGLREVVVTADVCRVTVISICE